MKKRRKVISCIATGIVCGILILNAIPKVIVNKVYNHVYKENLIKYEEQLHDYNEYVNKYADYINSLGLDSDMEIIVKVIRDMWLSIQGYGFAEKLPLGLYRLSFQEEGLGVCTSFADDFTHKMNAINPKYNAENIYVYMNEASENTKVDVINIERNKISQDNSNGEVEQTNFQKSIGNHMVSLITIPDKNYYLIVDPTNLFIGIFKNGKIEILNCSDKNIMDYRINSNLMLSEEELGINLSEYFKSFIPKSDSDKEIEELYGYKAQSEALANVKKLDLIPGYCLN